MENAGACCGFSQLPETVAPMQTYPERIRAISSDKVDLREFSAFVENVYLFKMQKMKGKLKQLSNEVRKNRRKKKMKKKTTSNKEKRRKARKITFCFHKIKRKLTCENYEFRKSYK